ncbi:MULTISPECIES: hypothetical protein [Mycobacterium]|uniref:Uncharacterized protein n=1 Tax=Mycobacterium paraintracellulare TaxID=1138383 RepID=A0ABN6AX79_9MYCO|nr:MULTISPECIES: hypothetical protein [Mycobacterium]AFC54337.1 hypothetical protein OCQ_28250 [Mycobacterium paraintracellulare]OSC28655.1 hypothetical protein B8W68_06975 [Mycobacterium paraintracellulare]WSE53732.1 hypothetical protein QGN31_12280 [Mycobacterium sp. 2-64]BBY72507.1 hypothetical protein MPRI_46940 [Mycobacterium paraintracellulare]BCO89603.1 hypothetical protein MINTM015_28600 [Mycobacterium paraintracellulare]
MILPADYIPMPTELSPPTGSSVGFTAAAAVIVVALLVWWWFSGERRRGPILPLLFVGIAISAIVVEPVYDNTLEYWYPPDNALGLFNTYERTVPLFTVIGYAWFFGGTSYILWRLFQRRVSRRQIWGLFGIVVVIDALATATAGWLGISGFYGDQPFMFGGVNVWFAFADATGSIVGAVILYLLVPRMQGWKWLWLLVIPTISYGAVLGGVTSPVVLGLHSDWTTSGRWLGGAGTIALCCVVTYGCVAIAEKGLSFGAVSIPRNDTAPEPATSVPPH